MYQTTSGRASQASAQVWTVAVPATVSGPFATLRRVTDSHARPPRPVATLVELYDLRWQIERFFKELKSTLGLAQYRFRQFVKVEGWTQACLQL